MPLRGPHRLKAGAYTQELVGRAITLVRLGSQCIRMPTKLRGKMKTQLSPRSVLGITRSMAILVVMCGPAYAQWVKLPAPAIPRAADGKPNLSAPAPRLPDGHPDLSGIWQPNGNRYAVNIARDLKADDVPFLPWAR